MEAAKRLSQTVGVVEACRALAVARASFYRHLSRCHLRVVCRSRRQHPRGLYPEERQEVVEVLNSERFVDLPRGRSMPPCWMKAGICVR